MLDNLELEGHHGEKRWRGEEQDHLSDLNTEEILAQGKLGRVPAEALHGSGMNPSYLLILLIMSLVYISCLSVLCFFHFSPHCYIKSLVKHSVAFRGGVHAFACSSVMLTVSICHCYCLARSKIMF